MHIVIILYYYNIIISLVLAFEILHVTKKHPFSHTNTDQYYEIGMGILRKSMHSLRMIIEIVPLVEFFLGDLEQTSES